MVLYALAERWWDTTNTFHISFREMTMTLLDFHVITGFLFGGNGLYLNKYFCTNMDMMEALLEV